MQYNMQYNNTTLKELQCIMQGVQSVLLSYFSYFLAFCPTFVLLFGILSYFPTFLAFYSTLFAKLPNWVLNFKNLPAAGLSLFLYSILLINCCSCQIFILYTNYFSENITEWMYNVQYCNHRHHILYTMYQNIISKFYSEYFELWQYCR